MPLMRVEVKNEYGLGAPEMYMEVNNDEPNEIFEGIAVSGLVGVLRLLGDLADFAAKVFHSLHEEAVIACSRSYKLMGRVERIEVALVPVEKALLAQKSHLHLTYTAGVNWTRSEKNHLVYSHMPQFVLDSYEECRSPPHFHLLDRFDPGGPGSCFKRYSDPTIFSNASSDAGTQKFTRDMKVQKSNVMRNDQKSMQSKEEDSRGFISSPRKSHGSDHQDHNDTQEQGFCSSYYDTWDEKTAIVEPSMEDYEHDTNLESLITRLDLETLGFGPIHLNSIHENCGIQDSSFDLQSLRIQNQSFEKESRKDTNSMDLPPLPPVKWCVVKPCLHTRENSNATHKAINCATDLQHSSSSSSKQHDRNLETANEQKSKTFSSEKSNVQREANQGKNIDENNFLNQIRARLLSLRPTDSAKSIVPLRSSTNIQVMTILEKANAIRQAVGSDDGDNWSDT